jgi:hypothetical protein
LPSFSDYCKKKLLQILLNGDKINQGLIEVCKILNKPQAMKEGFVFE